MMKCRHENSTITVNQKMISEIIVSDLEVYDGMPTVISYEVDCPECGLSTKYHESKLPVWIKEIIRNLGLKSNE